MNPSKSPNPERTSLTGTAEGCESPVAALYAYPLTSPASEFDAFGPLFFLSSYTGPAAPLARGQFMH
jgi:hypothetical protein